MTYILWLIKKGILKPYSGKAFTDSGNLPYSVLIRRMIEMKKSSLGFVLVALFAIVSWGCNGGSGGGDSNTTSTSSSTGDHDHDHDHEHDHDHAHDSDTTSINTSTILCGSCGESKGTESCCADGKKCGNCGLSEGSSLCCIKLPESSVGKDICGDCGHIAANVHKCDSDCDKCTKCGLHAGAPACCKLNS